MRLDRLDLIRYGRFTDHALDFGPAPVDGPDLHIVFGANEAGKSTAMAAWLDLLYGIEPRSRYAFLHPYDAMRVGATVTLAGGARQLARVKGVRDTLRGPDDRPLDDALFAADLAGIDRATHRTMFSLDDATLEEGGDSILASRGELGALLFSATAGLSRMGRTLDALRAGADAFHARGKRKTGLAEMKAALDALRDQAEALDVRADDYARRIKARDAAAAALTQAQTRRRDADASARALEARLAALRRLPGLRALRAERDGLPAFAPPPGWRETFARLATDATALATRLETLEADIARLSAARDAITPDAAALALADRLAALDTLRARDATAAEDLPKRREELADAGRALAALLARLGQPETTDPARLVLGPKATGALRALSEERSGVAARLEAATATLAQAAERLAQAAAPPPATAPEAVATLAALVEEIGEADADANVARAQATAAACAQALADSLAALNLGSEAAEALARLSPPAAEDVARWTLAAPQAEAERARRAETLAEREAECARLAAARAALRDSGAALGLDDVAALRAAREALWAAHRAALDAASADAFEAALRRDDAAGEARLGAADARARLAELAEAEARASADRDAAAAALTRATGARDALAAEIAAACAALAPFAPPAPTPFRLRDWLAARATALTQADALRAARGALAAATAARDAARARLVAALGAAGVAADVSAPVARLLRDARAAVETAREAARARAAHAALLRDRAAAEAAHAAAALAEQDWRARFAAACADTWLGAGGGCPALETVREALPLLDQLAPAREARDRLAERVAAMEADRRAYAAAITALAAEAGIAGDAAAADPALRARVAGAQRQQTARDAKQDALDASETALRALDEALRAHIRDRDAFLALAQAATLPEAGARMEGAARRAELDARIAAEAQEIAATLRVSDPAAAEAALADADAPALEADRAAACAQAEALDPRIAQLAAEAARAADAVAAVGGDEAAARLAARRATLLIAIEDEARAHLRRRIGAALVARGLDAYRETHRSGMLRAASDAFAAITGGRHARLAARREGETETLIALSADGASKTAPDLSKGARHQLYLALRVAGYREVAATRPPPPFWADDILETFDDARTMATLRVLSDMARAGQVICLTHHAHVVEIAREAAPEARIHHLA